MIVINVNKWVARPEVERLDKAAFSQFGQMETLKPLFSFSLVLGQIMALGSFSDITWGRLESLL